MNKNNIASKIVSKMMEQDHFSRWLGINLDAIGEGSCQLSMTLRKDMLNGFGIAHGGIAFSLADSALAFASNSHNRKSLVIETSMSFTAPAKEGDTLKAVAEQVSLTGRTGIYQIVVTNQEKIKIAIFKGVVFRKSDLWFPDGE